MTTFVQSKLSKLVNEAVFADKCSGLSKLVANKNVQAFAASLHVFVELQNNANKAFEVMSSIDDLASVGKVSTLVDVLANSRAVKVASEFYDILVEKKLAWLDPAFLVSNKDYTKYLSCMALASIVPNQVANTFTVNNSIVDGTSILTLCEDFAKLFEDEEEEEGKEQKRDDAKVDALFAQINQEASNLISLVHKANYFVSVFVPSIDLLIAGTMSKIASRHGRISMFMSQLLNIVIKYEGLTSDKLFLSKGIFSSEMQPEDVAGIYDQAMSIWFKLFTEVGLSDMLTYFDDSYFTVQFTPEVLNAISEDYLSLFDKKTKVSYDANGLLPAYARKENSEFTAYVTHSATVDENDLGILGNHDTLNVDIDAVQALLHEVPSFYDSEEAAIAKGDLSVSQYTQVNLSGGDDTVVTVKNYTCSLEEQRKYQADNLTAQAIQVLSHFDLTGRITVGRYFDLTGRVYYKAPHDYFSPVANKNIRELVRVAENVDKNYYIDYDAEFTSDGKLAWLHWNTLSMTTEELLDKSFESVSYPFFAALSTALDNKVTYPCARSIFDSVQEFFAPALEGKSLEDKSTYTKEVASSLWKFFKEKVKAHEYTQDVYAEAVKFLKVMFSELPYGRCSFTAAYDATSSVTQLISLYCGEVALMEGCNVIPSANGLNDCVKDVYISITKAFLEAFPEILGEEVTEAELVDKLKANRLLVKYAWMTYIYGSPVDFIKAYGEDGLEKFEQFLAKTYPAFSHYIQVFQKLWSNPRKYTFNGRNKFLGRIHSYNATMPDGFEFNYIPVKSVDVFCPSFLKLKVTYPQVGYDLLNRDVKYSDNKNRKASDRSFSANITHSVDALFARETILMCEHLPKMYKLITSGFLEAATHYSNLRNAIEGITSFLASNGCRIDFSTISKKEARKLYYAVKTDANLYAKCEYVVKHQDKLFRALTESRFTSALWLIPFAGVALKELGKVFDRECSVFNELSKIAYKLMDKLYEDMCYAVSLDEKSTDNPFYFVNQLFVTLSLLPEEDFKVITIHDSFHVLPMFSKSLFNIVRMQYAKYAESDLYEYILASFFGRDFVYTEEMSFLNQKQKQELSSKVYSAPFIVTF